MTTERRRPIYFFASLVVMPLCILEWVRLHQFPWLAGVSICCYLITMRVGEAVAATKRDLRDRVRSEPKRSKNRCGNGDRPAKERSHLWIPYLRASVMGIPFCTFEWFWKRQVIFLVGIGFFAALIVPALHRPQGRSRTD